MCVVRWSESAEGRPTWRGGPAADDPGPGIGTGGFPKLLLLVQAWLTLLHCRGAPHSNIREWFPRLST